MKKHLKKIITLLALAMLVFLGFLGYRYYQVQAFSKSLHGIELKNKTPKRYKDSEVSNDWADITQAQAEAQKMGIPDNAYGILEIPSIDMELPIFRGSNEYTLSLGAGTYFYDAKAGEGNLILSGHNTPYAGMLFTNLPDIKQGAQIAVRTLDKTVTYRVTNISIISNHFELDENGVPLDAWMKLPEKDEKAKISLFTCINWQNTSQRLLVEGEMVA